MKIVDRIQQLEAEGTTWFSLEFFPPRTEAGVENLIERVARFSQLNPVFLDITWGAGGSTSETTLDLATTFQNVISVETQMHLTCTNMPQQKLIDSLKRAHDQGIQNLVCLRGDPAKGADEWTAVEGGLNYAVDLVKLVRREYGDYFGIAVAGYPEGHPDGDYQTDLQHLKAKIDAGADIIITQLFYDVDIFLQFVKDVRALGITAPILPGIMPIQSHGAFERMTGFCKTKIPQYILDALEPIKNDDEAVKAYGVELAVQMCRKIRDAGIKGFHFYTMNLEKTVMDILARLELIPASPSLRQLPWRPSKAPRRQTEEVRPIFWSNRPKSYLARTETWDDFPNGRWGDLRSPAFGELPPHLVGRLNQEKSEKLQKIYGFPTSEQDVFNVFAKYLDGSVPCLPWTDVPMASESSYIRTQLIKMNQNGYLTTNSQPAVNGASSSDPVVGWGRPDGYVYQKAYVEFFASPERVKALEEAVARFPTLQLMATDRTGQNVISNSKNERNVTAVTWGVFPGREIMQPTVVDTAAFMAWKDEAFALWMSEWANLYPADSPSRAVIQNIHDTYFLVSVVDNDYMKPSQIFEIFGASSN